jgi:hypothetical protein
MSSTTPSPENSGFENQSSAAAGPHHPDPHGQNGTPPFGEQPDGTAPGAAPGGAAGSQQSVAPGQTPPKKGGKLKYILGGCGCLVLLLIVIAGCSVMVFGGGSDDADQEPASVSESTEAKDTESDEDAVEDDSAEAEDEGEPAEEASEKTEAAEKESEKKEETPAEKEDSSEEKGDGDVPAEYTSALNKAETYSELMYMSKKGIYDQLTSEYGEGFTPEAAQYAIDTIDADWNRNALEKAKTYQSEMDMSPAAIHDQLTSEYGEQFTQEQADYAVDHLEG